MHCAPPSKEAIPKRQILAMVTPVEILPPLARLAIVTGIEPIKRPNSNEMKSWTNLAPKKV